MRMLTSASLSQGRGLWRNGVEPLDDASPRSDFRDRYEYGDLQGLYPVGLANWCAWARWVRTEGGNVRGRRRAIVGGAGGVDGRLGGRCEALCDEFDRADVFAAIS